MEYTQGKGFSNARVSNTALDSQTHAQQGLTATVDWLTLQFREVNIDKLVDCIQDLLQVSIFFDGKQVEQNEQGTWNVCQGTGGISFLWKSDGTRSYGDASLVLPGGFLCTREYWHVHRVSRRLASDFGGMCSRIDLAVDDYDRALDFRQILDAIELGEVVGFQKSKYIESYGGVEAGKTIYLGTRRSNKYGRIYDRLGVTKGKENCIRFEVEYKRGMARSVFTDYIKAERSTVLDKLGGIIKTAFGFAHKKDKNLDRAVVKEWWAVFCQRIGGCPNKIRVKPEKKSIEKSLHWVKKSVSKTLLKIVGCIGIEGLHNVLNVFIAQKIDQLREVDKAHINEFRDSPMSVADIIAQIA